MDYRERLKNLELELSKEFSELLETQNTILFSQEDLEYDDIPEIFEARNDMTGNVFDVYIMRIDNGMIVAREVDDVLRTHLLKFSDLSSILDRINLIQILREN